MKAISLFSGAGGMDVGFKKAGFNIIAANELDTHACSTFRTNHSETQLFEGDLVENLENITGFTDIDIVFGGPPCQGFSVAGKMDPSDPRSKLIFSFADVVEKVKPKSFVMENVKSLGSLAKFSEIRQELLSRFHKAGYQVNMHILNAKDFGVPQSRERVFFIGIKTGHRPIIEKNFKKFLKQPPTLRETIKPLGRAGSKTNNRICNAKITIATNPILRKSPYAGMMFNGQGRPLNPDGWASTLPASMGGNRTPIIDESHLYDDEPSMIESYHLHLINGGKPYKIDQEKANLRRLTIDEAALLQGFPHDYIFCGPSSRIYSQIGNAVPCKLAEVVARTVYDSLTCSNKVEQFTYDHGENLSLALS